MPCGTVARHVLLPPSAALVGHFAYEVVPSHDAMDSKYLVDKRGDLSSASTLSTPSLNVPVQPVREVLFYASEEEEYVSTPTLGVTNSLSDDDVVVLPNLEGELKEWFPTTEVALPPPPVTSKSVQAMRLWHAHLVIRSSYPKCVRVAGCECPPVPCSQDEELHDEWVRDCKTWWTHLRTSLSQSGVSFKVLSERRWNPYSLTQSMEYVGSAEPADQSETKADMTLIHYPLPPPPAFAQATEEYRTIVKSATAALRSFVAAMTVWWRKACEWAAAANQKHVWLTPPPTTGRDAEDWWRLCDEWWVATTTGVRKDAEPAPTSPRPKRIKRAKAQAHTRHSSDINSLTVSST